MAQMIACPECDKTLQVPDDLIGKLVQCPRCQHTFIATGTDNAIESPKTAQPGPTRIDKDDDLEDEGSKRRSRSRVDDDDDDTVPSIRKRKPGHVTSLGVMALVGGIVGVSMFLLLVGGSGLACCLWPGTYYSLVAGILAIIRGAALLGERAFEQPLPKTIAILMIINIINGDVINLVLGIIMMVFCDEGDVIEYFRKPAHY
jgi:Zn-finger nucleic acid-binding protein